MSETPKDCTQISDTETEDNVTQDAIKGVVMDVIRRSDEELFSLSQEGLDCYWHFRWYDAYSFAYNIHEFNDCLDLFKRFCRRWEEHHHGSVCVVERVRDIYLMPKIEEFMAVLKEKMEWM
jgi:hypothetical protein